MKLRKFKTIRVVGFIFILMILTMSSLFNLPSNIEYAFDNSNQLTILTSDGYKILQNHTKAIKQKELYSNEKVRILKIKVRRKDYSIIHKVEDFINPNKLIVFEFLNDNKYALYAETANNFNPVTSADALKKSNANFVLNTNYYGKSSEVLNEVIINGKRYGKQNRKASGFFKVINDKPYVGSRSMFNNIHGPVIHSCQAFPSVMKSGVIFSYILTEKYPYRKNWKTKTYRNLIGTNKKGNLVVLVSNKGALLSVKEITQIAKSMGVENASLFDGGAALQYQYKDEKFSLSFAALNNRLSLGNRVDHLFLKLKSVRFCQKSPVYLTVKHN